MLGLLVNPVLVTKIKAGSEAEITGTSSNFSNFEPAAKKTDATSSLSSLAELVKQYSNSTASVVADLADASSPFVIGPLAPTTTSSSVVVGPTAPVATEGMLLPTTTSATSASSSEESLLSMTLQDHAAPAVSSTPDATVEPEPVTEDVTQEKISNELLDLSLPENLSAPISVTSKGDTNIPAFTMLIKGADLSATSTKINGTITYPESFASTDLEYSLTDKGLKENIILKDKAHPYQFEYVLNLDEYDYKQVSKNKIELYKKGQKDNLLFKQFVITAPVMTDSSGASSTAITLESNENLLTLTPDSNWLSRAKYPVVIDPTVEISVINIHSHPIAGEYWNVDFVTQGTADLSLTPGDHATVDDMQFNKLTCGTEDRSSQAQVLAGNVISYPNWSCDDIATASYLDLKTGNHKLVFGFGGQLVKAFNSSLPEIPRPDLWVTDGEIYTSAVSGNSLYIGGWFSYVGPNTGHAVVYNSTTKTRKTFPHFDDQVISAVSDGDNGWYVGGLFRTIDTVDHPALAHVLSDGTLDTNFNANFLAYSQVNTIVKKGNYLYIGGSIKVTGDVGAWSTALVLDATTGAAYSWRPNLITWKYADRNADIYSLLIDGNTLYVAGNITKADGQVRSGIVAYDITAPTSPTLTSFNPVLTWTGSDPLRPTVNSVVQKGSVLYVGGSFSTVNGQARTNAAGLDLTQTNGGPTSFAPVLDGKVNALAINNDTLYVAGNFTHANSQVRGGGAAFNTLDDSLLGWDPHVRNIAAIATDGTTVFISGDFTSAGGFTTEAVGTVDPITGNGNSWNLLGNSYMNNIVVNGNEIFFGGKQSSLGGVSRNHLAAIDLNTGMATDWNAYTSRPINSIALKDNSVLYVACYSSCSDWTIGGVAQKYLAAIDAVTGLPVQTFNPNANGQVSSLIVSNNYLYVGGSFCNIGNTSLPKLCYLARLNLATGNSDDTWDPEPNWNSSGWINTMAMSADGLTLYAGGYFNEIGDATQVVRLGAARSNLAAISTATGLPTAWNPNVNDEVLSLLFSNGIVYAGGWFWGVNGGTARNYVAAFDANVNTNNVVANFDPNPDRRVTALAMSEDGTTLYMGGFFYYVGAVVREALAGINVADGSVLSWSPNPDYGVVGNGVEVYSLTTAGGALFVGGNFSATGPLLSKYNYYAIHEQPYLAQFGTFTSATPAGVTFNESSGSTAVTVGGATDSYTMVLNTQPAGDVTVTLSSTPGATTSVASLIFTPANWETPQTVTISGTQAAPVGISTSTISHVLSSSDPNYLNLSIPDINVAVSHVMLPGAGSEIPRPDLWVTDNEVFTSAVSGNTLYIGGSFSYVGPNTGRAALYDRATRTRKIFPKFDDAVEAGAPDGSGGWYVGGSYQTIRDVSNAALAHVLPDGSLDPNFNANFVAWSEVTAIAKKGNYLFVAGDVKIAGDSVWNTLLVLNATTGQAYSWRPNLLTWKYADTSADIYSMLIDGNTLYVAGNITKADGQVRSGVVAYDITAPTAPTLTNFNPVLTWAPGWNPLRPEVKNMVLKGSVLYIGGSFSTVNGQARTNAAGLDLTQINGGPTNFVPVLDDKVSSLALIGDTLYIAGDFTHANSQPRGAGAAYNLLDNSLLSWDPQSRYIMAMATDGTTVFIGGSFGQAGGVTSDGVGSVDAITGNGNTWNLQANNYMYNIIVGDGEVFFGGRQSSMGGVLRNNLAAIDLVTGMATDWNPGSSAYIYNIAANKDTVYVSCADRCYSDWTIGGTSQNYLAAIDAATGLPIPAFDPNPDYEVDSLLLTNNHLYVGGLFSTIGHTSLPRLRFLARLDLTTGRSDDSWDPEPNWNSASYSGLYISDMKMSDNDSTLYVGGYFNEIGDKTGINRPGAARNNLAAIDTATGLPTAWDPNVNRGVDTVALKNGILYAGGGFTSVNNPATSRNYIAAFDTALNTNNVMATFNPNPNYYVTSSAISDDGATLYVSGDFDTIGGQNRNYLAALDTTDGSVLSWNPNPDHGGDYYGTNINNVTLAGEALFVSGYYAAMGPIDPETGWASHLQSNLAQLGTFSPYVPPVVLSGVTFNESSGSTAVTVGGATDSYTMVLNTQPAGDVTVTLSSTPGATTSVASLIFTPANWETPQTVTISGTAAAPAGFSTSTISHTVTSADAGYDNLSIPDISVAVTNNLVTPPAGGSGGGGSLPSYCQLNTSDAACSPSKPDDGAKNDPPWKPDYQDNLPLTKWTVDEQCMAFSGQSGWFGRYFDYPKDHPDMELPGSLWNKHFGDPLSKAKPWSADWYDLKYFRFAKLSPDLKFGTHFFPFDYAPEKFIAGHANYFGSEWSSKVSAPENDYSFRISSDDDSWIYIDGKLVMDNSGVHGATTKTGTVRLNGTHLVQIFFAERHTVESHFYFIFDDPKGQIRYAAFSSDCREKPVAEKPVVPEPESSGNGTGFGSGAGLGPVASISPAQGNVGIGENNGTPLPVNDAGLNMPATAGLVPDSSQKEPSIKIQIFDIIAAIGLNAKTAIDNLTVSARNSTALRPLISLVSLRQAAKVSATLVAPAVLVSQYSLALGQAGWADLWLYALRFFYGLMILFGIRHRRKVWGTVYDSVSKQPLDPAIVELVDFVTGKSLEQSITDLEGRFGFLDKPGKFLLKAKKTHYQFPTQRIWGSSDGIYNNLYRGGLIAVEVGGNVVSPNIPMDPLEFDWNQMDKQRLVKFHPKLEMALHWILFVLFYLGFVLALANFILIPSLVTGILLVLYAIYIALRLLIPNPRLWGKVISQGIPVEGLVVELSPTKLPNVVMGKAKVSAQGKFFLKAPPGNYFLKVIKKGEQKVVILKAIKLKTNKHWAVNNTIKIS